jgi:NADH dehydrogenase
LLPGIAPVAMQQAKYISNLINNNVSQERRKPFHYFDKGMMTTIGKAKTVARIRKLEFKGFIVCFFLVVHTHLISNNIQKQIQSYGGMDMILYYRQKRCKINYQKEKRLVEYYFFKLFRTH